MNASEDRMSSGTGGETIRELIHRRRRQVLVHSILYYRLGKPLISDRQFDRWVNELADLQQRYPDQAAAVAYHRGAFRDFAGSTGFDLPLDDPQATATARRLLARHEGAVRQRHPRPYLLNGHA